MKRCLPLFALVLALIAPASADETKTKRIEFERGKSEVIVTGEITGRDDVLYKLNARDGQFLHVQMLPEGRGAEKPGRCCHDGTKCTGTMYLGEG